MLMISSESGSRLAKAKARCDSLVGTFPAGPKADRNRHELYRATVEFNQAAKALADELVADGYHELDGGEG